VTYTAKTKTFTWTRADDVSILGTVEPGSVLPQFDGLVIAADPDARDEVPIPSRFTCRNRADQIVIESRRITVVSDTQVRVDLTHVDTAVPAGVYDADLELVFEGGPDGGPTDLRRGTRVRTIWSGRVQLTDDESKEVLP